MLQITPDMTFVGLMTIFFFMGTGAIIGIIYEFLKKRKLHMSTSTSAGTVPGTPQYSTCTFCGHRNLMYKTTCEKCGADI